MWSTKCGESGFEGEEEMKMQTLQIDKQLNPGDTLQLPNGKWYEVLELCGVNTIGYLYQTREMNPHAAYDRAMGVVGRRA